MPKRGRRVIEGSDGSPEKKRNCRIGFRTNKKARNSQAFLVELREKRGHFIRTIAGILSSPHVLWGSSLEMTAENMDGVICKSHSRESVLSRKSGKSRKT